MDWEEKDKEIMDRINKSSENLEIPKTLSPENMMRKLENEELKKKKHIKWIIKITAAAACMGMVSLSLWQLRVMNTGINKTIVEEKDVKDEPVNYNDYSSIYQKLKNTKIEKVSYEDVYEKELIVEDVIESGNGDTTGNERDNISGTNIQVEGIDEADVVKNDREYIYVLDMSDNKVSIIRMTDEKKVSDIQIIDGYLSYFNAEMYVLNDILVVVGTYVNNETQICIYDISDRGNPIKINSISQQGNYNTSRLSGDYLYVMSDSYIRGELSEDNCVPRLEGKQIETDCVVISEKVTALEYEFIISIDLKSPESILDKKAITKDTANGCTYVSAGNIYVTNYIYSDDTTIITKLGYAEGKFTDVFEGKVDGRLYGQFAMDEYNGYLRLVSTDMSAQGSSNIVYVLDSSLQIAGRIEGIAEGESIYSARFMGDIGYFVTYYQTDPLFKVDFSNPANPVILGELEITGYSDYLHLWDDNKLMGLGYVDDKLKLSMFQLNDNGDMKEITRKVFEDCYQSPATYNHKALMIDPELNIIGLVKELSLEDYSKERIIYEVYSYIDGEFVCRLSLNVGEIDWENYNNNNVYTNLFNIRGVYYGDKLFIVIPGEKVFVYNLNTMEAQGEIDID